MDVGRSRRSAQCEGGNISATGCPSGPEIGRLVGASFTISHCIWTAFGNFFLGSAPSK